MYNPRSELDYSKPAIMINPPKKSSTNSYSSSVLLFDQLISRSPGLAPIVAQACQTHAQLPERLTRLKPLIAYEHSVLSKPAQHLLYYCTVAYRSLTDAFILTQRQAAMRRIETSANPVAKALLSKHTGGDRWISVGISHLTTSRQHVNQPVVTAKANPNGWSISGTVPWVTAAAECEALVIAACDWENHSHQYLFYLPMGSETIKCQPRMELMALTQSDTCEVRLDGIELTSNELLHGPSENVLSMSQSGGAGGLQTTALALGLAACVIDRIKEKSRSMESLAVFNQQFSKRWGQIFDQMIEASDSSGNSVDTAKLRKDANDLTLRVAQAFLAIEKGTGYLADSDASRWVREAMFFLVWSCPQAIAKEHLCDLSHFDSNLFP